jgi:hypothetical protein
MEETALNDLQRVEAARREPIDLVNYNGVAAMMGICGRLKPSP